MKATRRGYPKAVVTTMLLVLVLSGRASAGERESLFMDGYFKIQVVDRSTGRGVPLVELRTVNNIRYYTDSNGIVAFCEPGLMDREVFFFVESHGYEFPKDGFGFRGTRLKTTPGGSATIKIDRLNIAERLYRITGQGIYRDSVLTDHPVPLKNPVLNGQVCGQDSVYTCIYHGRLFWLWGDTNRPSYPLGHFATAGAFSDLPASEGLDPAVGVNLEYFVDENGFSRPLCPLKERGLVWLDGLLTVKDKQGRQRMVAKYARMKNLGTALERGLVVFNDATNTFEPIVRSGPDFLPYHNSGHALAMDVEGQRYYYFATQFPLSVRMRVKADWDSIVDPNCYEVLTSLKPQEPYRWHHSAELIGAKYSSMPELIKALKKQKQDTYLYDIESGRKVSPHGGSVYFNTHRKKWVMITVEQGGGPSYLGEVWYAEADTPIGPWAYVKKIVTHNKYTFYNPMQHPYFDKDGGRTIFFEGTYAHTFSGSADNPTPRYDYNQIMYRLNLSDPRLVLPAAVYQVPDKKGGFKYLLRDGLEEAGLWDSVESVAFYALEPQQGTVCAKANPGADLVPIYANELGLTTKRPNESAELLFCALSKDESPGDNTAIVPLYEYLHTESDQRRYSTDPNRQQKDWVRTAQPLCQVCKTPPGPLLLDRAAKPCRQPGRVKLAPPPMSH